MHTVSSKTYVQKEPGTLHNGDFKKYIVIRNNSIYQNIEKYRGLLPHISAAIRLSNEDKHPSMGYTIKYIYANSQRRNPLCRVVPVENIHNTK